MEKVDKEKKSETTKDKETTEEKRNVYIELMEKLILVAILLFVVSVGSFIYYRNEYKLYFADTSYQYDTTIPDSIYSGNFVTTIDYDNKYVNDNVKSENDALNLIINESEKQKAKCLDNKNKDVEDRIQKKYNIAAVNLCELDHSFALEIEKVIDNVYKKYPNIGGYMSNLTLINAPDNSSNLASFEFAFIFSTSSKNRGYPWVVKNMIILNSNYYLDNEGFARTIKDSVRSGWFPKNASRDTIIAHEMGHYLSFVALNKTYNTNERFLIKKINRSNYYNMISDYSSGKWAKGITDQAYENYNNKYPGKYSNEYEFRASISSYATAINGKGEFIYDETIAEAFHDYYINKDNATDASKEIVKVLGGYLK